MKGHQYIWVSKQSQYNKKEPHIDIFQKQHLTKQLNL